MELRKNNDILPQPFAQCHNGQGTLLCKSLLDGFDSENFPFMHTDTIPAGVSIGLHLHEGNEEIYYLISGTGVLTYDDTDYDMQAGDISLCKSGHSHAFRARTDCTLIVVGSR